MKPQGSGWKTNSWNHHPVQHMPNHIHKKNITCMYNICIYMYHFLPGISCKLLEPSPHHPTTTVSFLPSTKGGSSSSGSSGLPAFCFSRSRPAVKWWFLVFRWKKLPSWNEQWSKPQIWHSNVYTDWLIGILICNWLFWLVKLTTYLLSSPRIRLWILAHVHM